MRVLWVHAVRLMPRTPARLHCHNHIVFFVDVEVAFELVAVRAACRRTIDEGGLRSRLLLLLQWLNLHENRHSLRHLLRVCTFIPFLPEQLQVNEVVQWSLLFEELLVVGEINAWENPFEKVAPRILINGVLEARFLLFLHVAWFC